MKYIKFIGLAALAMAFSACDDIEDSNSLPQTNPQLPGVDADNVAVTAGADATEPIVLQVFNDADETINIANIATPSDWPEGYTPEIPSMQMSSAADFTTYVDVPTHIGAEGAVMVNPDDWDGAWKKYFGKNPAERTVYLRFPVYAAKGTELIRMGGANRWYGSESVTVSPFNPFDHIIEESYYMIGSFCNWDLSQAVKLDHSDYDPYDDPFFKITVKVTDPNYEWAIVPASTVAAGNILAGSYGGEYPGIDGTNGGFLLPYTNEAPAAISFPEQEPYIITLDMEKLSYTVAPAWEVLYTPGNSNGWNFGASQTLTTQNYSWYNGFCHLNGEFKLTSTQDWKTAVAFGAGDKAGKLSTDGKAPNLNAEADGLYYVTADINELKYSLVLVDKLGIIGNATPSGWDGQTDFTPSADFLVWSAEVEFAADGEWKFRMNDNWDYNLGGDPADLSVDGANMPTPGAGKYLVTLNLTTRPYFVTLTPQ